MDNPSLRSGVCDDAEGVFSGEDKGGEWQATLEDQHGL